MERYDPESEKSGKSNMGHKEHAASKTPKPLSTIPSRKVMDKKLLSTKKLAPAEKVLLENAGIRVRDYDAIQIKFLPASIPDGFDHLIFTSKNGVKAYLHSLKSNPPQPDYKESGCYCVGHKTKALLEKKGWKVLGAENTAKELASYLLEKARDKSFLYVCGNRRRDELPGMLKAHGVSFTELEVYETLINAIKISGSFDAILFFSPSGIRSFLTHNTINNAIAYCIGPTTAAEIEKHTNRYKTADVPEIARVVQLALDDLNPGAKAMNISPGE